MAAAGRYSAGPMSDTDNLDIARTDALARIDAAADLTQLEAIRIALLGKQGSISALMKTLGAMAPEER